MLIQDNIRDPPHNVKQPRPVSRTKHQPPRRQHGLKHQTSEQIGVTTRAMHCTSRDGEPPHHAQHSTSAKLLFLFLGKSEQGLSRKEPSSVRLQIKSCILRRRDLSPDLLGRICSAVGPTPEGSLAKGSQALTPFGPNESESLTQDDAETGELSSAACILMKALWSAQTPGTKAPRLES